ncbi:MULTISPECIES: hypothetical protein [Stenotrophomonas]|jgi:hypothetical protein|uniref:Uncharacterized protein n=1 Tax=Stenotrophomonas acidaminiphila TaxID=128780 RepID=A0A0R0DN75_9GAMM|nr:MULTISPECIES: hypothetical protein [Stenotrophomonas]ODU46838.1 MAG: hypothetical protein ABS96_07440 [Xanthomonadaceae bacterium SCN 69-123]OJY80313.1 MAG: hypothetical protein BGP18_15590 [Stenotrophomonas sp. 69-14]OZB52334.1 MAG: hypothetical protein B7X38_08930 [Stenotrophomonas sp. 14-69-23]ALJ28020.1 hypothetical protein AOT14_16320 [Stenotrophomonas acidaminiphila]KRG82742.1 hypothetical protein ABB33_15500 [Stenotrophomonas acidaminiphila]
MKILAGALLLAAGVVAPSAHAAGNIDCELRFNLSGWSIFYKTATGNGTITCDNGASIPVKIRAKGGGLTVGKSTVSDGRGKFTGAYSVNDLIGTYGGAEVHAGASRSSNAQVVTKGDISLALAGTGRGWDLGVGFGKFVIERR